MINFKNCSAEEVADVEAGLRRDGYRLVSKTLDKDLKPGEYIKSSYTGSEKKIRWTLRIKTKPPIFELPVGDRKGAIYAFPRSNGNLR